LPLHLGRATPFPVKLCAPVDAAGLEHPLTLGRSRFPHGIELE
jgi:hypothetical protein